MMHSKPLGAAVYGVDLGKKSFHVVGTDAAGSVIQRAKFRRETALIFFERADRALVHLHRGSDGLAVSVRPAGPRDQLRAHPGSLDS
jgi:transposase